jgi:hypothetical protein
LQLFLGRLRKQQGRTLWGPLFGFGFLVSGLVLWNRPFKLFRLMTAFELVYPANPWLCSLEQETKKQETKQRNKKQENQETRNRETRNCENTLRFPAYQFATESLWYDTARLRR